MKFWHLSVSRSRGDGEDAIRWTGQESTPVERLLHVLRHSMQLEISTEEQKLKEGCYSGYCCGKKLNRNP